MVCQNLVTFRGRLCILILILKLIDTKSKLKHQFNLFTSDAAYMYLEVGEKPAKRRFWQAVYNKSAVCGDPGNSGEHYRHICIVILSTCTCSAF